MKPRRVIISGGGTGGHVYPALAVGRKLREKDPSLGLTFVGSHREIERRIMEEQGVDFIPLRIEGLKGRGIRSVRSAFLLPFSFMKSWALLLRLKPALVIGVGGYSSGPIVWLASWMRIPTLLLEQNVRPGFTNRLLARRANRVVTAFESSLPFFRGKGVWLGNPVREEFTAIPPRPRQPRLSLLVFGGSQGSRFLNRIVMEALPRLAERKGSLAFIHQTGPADFESVAEAYRKSDFETAEVAPYYPKMADCFRRSDLVLCRAGATTCAELIASRKPSILVPFAGASENHQEGNAREMEKAGGAEVILERDLTPELLAQRILASVENRERLDRMAAGLAALRTDGAADRIAGLCFRLMEGKD
jgi:UDP-N-acetylglucosamine--N-acetylmuramyl-(pentapeptide) pyrophosphoryl-undecaprenol N-acetylglucosamine transferase